MTPAMLISWVAGLALALHLGFGGGWLHLKIALVLFMTAAHGIMIGWHKRFTRGENVRTGTFYRIVNEVPTLLIIPVVILVIVQPF
jgi:putative membrane protein